MWLLTSASWTAMGAQRKLRRRGTMPMRPVTSTSWTMMWMRRSLHSSAWALQVVFAPSVHSMGFTKYPYGICAFSDTCAPGLMCGHQLPLRYLNVQ